MHLDVFAQITVCKIGDRVLFPLPLNLTGRVATIAGRKTLPLRPLACLHRREFPVTAKGEPPLAARSGAVFQEVDFAPLGRQRTPKPGMLSSHRKVSEMPGLSASTVRLVIFAIVRFFSWQPHGNHAAESLGRRKNICSRNFRYISVIYGFTGYRRIPWRAPRNGLKIRGAKARAGSGPAAPTDISDIHGRGSASACYGLARGCASNFASAARTIPGVRICGSSVTWPSAA